MLDSDGVDKAAAPSPHHQLEYIILRLYSDVHYFDQGRSWCAELFFIEKHDDEWHDAHEHHEFDRQ